MRTTIMGLLAAAAAAMITAQVSAADAPERPGGPPDPQVMFQRLDRNQDSKITADEVPEAAPDFVKEMLKRADKDSDKTVTAEEFRESVQRFREAGLGRPEGRPLDRQMRQPETRRPETRPGRSAVEAEGRRGGPPPSARPSPGMSRSGRPEQAGPRGPVVPPMGDPQAMFRRLDKDGDQKLSLDEFTAGMKAFHPRVTAGQRPAMGPPARGPQHGMGRPPMMGPPARGPQHGMGRPPMMGPPARGPQHGMGRPPMMGPSPFAPSGPRMHRGMHGIWGPSLRTHATWSRHAWGVWPGRPAPQAGRPAAGAPRGALSSHVAIALKHLQAHYDKVDTNKDGKLDKAELGKTLAVLGRQVRESVEKRRAELLERVQDARHKWQEKAKAADKAAEAKKHAEPKKPIDKKVEQQKAGGQKPEVKPAPEKKPPQKEAEAKKPKPAKG
jgi:Ca2+-binding EF-hand superfamily protein